MSFRDFRRQYPNFLAGLAVIILAVLAMDGWILYKRYRYTTEVARLRAGMSDVERRRSDAILAHDERRVQMMVQLIRRQARGAKDIHLAVSVDSGKMYLEREGATLREVPIAVGPERRVGAPPDTVHMAIPRGTRTVQRILGASDGWEIPRWVYMDRGIPVPEDRNVVGALGGAAILLDGGTVIYSFPSAGPLNDALYVLPGGVRASVADLRAILPNLKRGTNVYFY